MEDLSGAIDEQPQHIWIKGEWYRQKGFRGEYRDDHCALCKCNRKLSCETVLGAESKPYYIRGREHFGFKEPLCWGGREPG